MDARATSSAGAIPLNATERRLLGVLIEKGLTTPEYYPLSVNALLAGCNQKNNRDPLTNFDDSTVESGLKSLEQKGLVLSVIGETGRVARWRQELSRVLSLDVTELAVLGELLLRGAQSEGDLRGRASRMRPIESLEALRNILDKLHKRSPPLVLRLTQEGVSRGVRWTHGMASAEQLEKWRAEEPAGVSEARPDAVSAPPAPTPAAASHAATMSPASSGELVSRVAQLEARVAALEQRLSRLPGA